MPSFQKSTLPTIARISPVSARSTTAAALVTSRSTPLISAGSGGKYAAAVHGVPALVLGVAVGSFPSRRVT